METIIVDKKWIQELEAKIVSAPTPFFVSLKREGGGKTAVVVERQEMLALIDSARLMLIFRIMINRLWLAVFIALGVAVLLRIL